MPAAPEPKWLVFSSVAGARFYNQKWATLQTERTRNDPATVTKRLFSWSVNPSTGRAGMRVAEHMEKYLTAAERAQLKRREVVISNQDISPDARLSEESRAKSRPPSGGGRPDDAVGGGGGGGHGNE